MIVIITVAGAVGLGASVHLAHARNARFSPPLHFSAGEASLRLGSPEEALESVESAAARGDLEALRGAITPGVQQILDQHGGNLASHVMQMGSELAAGQLVKKEALSEREVILYLRVAGRDNPWQARMQNLGGAWKLAGLSQ